MADAEDVGSPMYGGDDVKGGPSDGAHFDQLKKIQEANPIPTPAGLEGSDLDPYSVARWAGHDFSDGVVSDNPQAMRLDQTPGMEKSKRRKAAPEHNTENGVVVAATSGNPIVSVDDPSGPKGGDVKADPVAGSNWWGDQSERNNLGEVTEVKVDTEEQDDPDGPMPGEDTVTRDSIHKNDQSDSDDKGVAAEDATATDEAVRGNVEPDEPSVIEKLRRKGKKGKGEDK